MGLIFGEREPAEMRSRFRFIRSRDYVQRQARACHDLAQSCLTEEARQILHERAVDLDKEAATLVAGAKPKRIFGW